jgi:hypothetical protein
LNRAFGLFDFTFPKHTSLLLDGKRETQVGLDLLPKPAPELSGTKAYAHGSQVISDRIISDRILLNRVRHDVQNNARLLDQEALKIHW